MASAFPDDELLDQALEGVLSPAAERQLVARLKADAGLARRLITLCRDEALLGEWAATRSVQQALDGQRRAGPAGARATVRPASAVATRRRVLPPAAARGWWVSGLAAAGLLVGVGIVGWHMDRMRLAPRTLAARLTDVREGGTVVRAGRRIPARSGLRVTPPCTLVTAGPGSGITVRYGDATKLALGAEATLELAATDAPRDRRLVLRHGRLDACVAPLTGANTAVLTPHAEVVVAGTRFTVDVEPDSSRVTVQDGSVRITDLRTRETATLAAGWSAVAGRAFAVIPGAAPAGGLAAAGGDRARHGLQVLYVFGARPGKLVPDRAGPVPALDLAWMGTAGVEWPPTGGWRLNLPTLLATEHPAVRLTAACRATHAITIEAWLTPANASQGTDSENFLARIVSCSHDTGRRNFTLGQAGDRFLLRLRTTETTPSGTRPAPARADSLARNCVLATEPGAAGPSLTHLVATRDAGGTLCLYLNGVENSRGHLAGDFSNWDDSCPLVVARELDPEGSLGTLNRAWLGTLHLVAIYNRALSPEEVGRNHRAGIPPAAAPTRSAAATTRP